MRTPRPKAIHNAPNGLVGSPATGREGGFMDADEVCQALSISRATLSNWRRLKKIDFFQDPLDPKRTVYPTETVKRLVEGYASGELDRLTRRRNKTRAPGPALGEGYVRDPQNARIASGIFGRFGMLGKAGLAGGEGNQDFMRLLLAASALGLAAKAVGNEKIQPAGMLADSISALASHLEGKSPAGELSWIVDDMLAGVKDYSCLWHPLAKEAFLLSQSLRPYPGENILGCLLAGLTDARTRRLRGIYYTPPALAEGLIDLCGDSVDIARARILDPCCGTGNFLLALAQRGTSPELLYGQDIDPLCIQLARMGFAVQTGMFGRDFLESHFVCADSLASPQISQSGPFDVIVGNPPWGGTRGLGRNAGPSLPQSCDMSDLFVASAVSSLGEGGLMAFVLPESLLSVSSHHAVRELLAASCTFRFARYLGEAFPGVECPCVLFGAQKTEKRSCGIGKVIDGRQVHSIAGDRQISARSFNFRVTDHMQDCLEAIASCQGMFTLAGNAEFALGIVTGDNRKILSPVQEEGYEPILRGPDIMRFRAKEPSSFVRFDPSGFQQTAREGVYRAPQKLVYRFIGKDLVFAYDDSGTLCLNSANILIPSKPGVDIMYILALLNSRAVGFFYSETFRSVKALRSSIEQLPLPAVSQPMHDLACGLASALVNAGPGEAPALYEELDMLVMGLYSLTRPQASMVRNSRKGERLLLPG